MANETPTSPYRRATNLRASSFEGKALSLFELHRTVMEDGQSIIRDRVFRNCSLEGPAVALILGDVNFDSTDFGYSGGDIRNLVLRPAGPDKVIGTIPIGACQFIGCRFFAVGFTGSEAFIQQLLAVPTR